MSSTRLSSKIAIIGMMLAILVAGCGKKTGVGIDFGTFNNSVYTNKYFGMSVTVPADWSIQDQSAQQRLMKKGGALLSGDNRNTEATLKNSEQRVVNLFAVFKYAAGSPVTFNPSIISMAEIVQDMPGIKRGSDYLFHVRKFMESGQLTLNFPHEIYSKAVGGVDFDVMDMEMTVRGQVVKQKYYAAIVKGYALGFVVSFGDDGQEAELQKILDTVKFDPATVQ